MQKHLYKLHRTTLEYHNSRQSAAKDSHKRDMDTFEGFLTAYNNLLKQASPKHTRRGNELPFTPKTVNAKGILLPLALIALTNNRFR